MIETAIGVLVGGLLVALLAPGAALARFRLLVGLTSNMRDLNEGHAKAEAKIKAEFQEALGKQEREFREYREAQGSRELDATTENILDEIRVQEPALVEIIERAPATPVEDVPAEIDASEVNGPDAEEHLAGIRDPHLTRFLRALHGWHPASSTYGDELGFGNSMVWHLTNRAKISRSEIQNQVPLRLELGGASKPLKPDFILWDRLLVEVKGDMDNSAASDRSMGQLFRYLLAWKSKGPSVLVICGRCDPVLLILIRIYVNIWRQRFRVPVTVFFASHEDASAVPIETGT
jgi:hypothetical protein